MTGGSGSNEDIEHKLGSLMVDDTINNVVDFDPMLKKCFPTSIGQNARLLAAVTS